MSNLRWSDEAKAVVDENDTIVYVVSAEVGAMIVGYQRQMEVIRTQTTVSGRHLALIADLRAALADAQAVAAEQSRLRAEADGKLAEATQLLEVAHDRITELVVQLAAALTTIEAAPSDGALYADGCKP